MKVSRPLAAAAGFSVALVPDTATYARWALTSPLRYYLRHFPLQRGKGLVQRIVISISMDEPEEIELSLPSGLRLRLSTREKIGQYLAIHGHFEPAELEACRMLSVPGSTVIDVGANVGIFTMTMAAAVGRTGKVLSLEALRFNFDRLTQNMARNSVDNVTAICCAAGAQSGMAQIDGGCDPAFSAVNLSATDSSGTSEQVEVKRLDDIWVECGTPHVSFIKIDVEGSEPLVLAGAPELLNKCRPYVLVETPTESLRSIVKTRLEKYGLLETQPQGFFPWNYLYTPR